MTTAARPKLLASTIDLVRRYGVAGTGIAQLLEHSGVARRTVYLNFPGGKAELVAAATETAGQGIAAMLTEVLATTDVDEAFGAFVQWWKDVLVGSDFSAGCPVAAAALGRADAATAADIAGDVFTQWEAVISGALRARNVPTDSADSLAATAIAAVEGAVIVCMAKRDTVPLDRVGGHLAELFTKYVDQT